MVPKAAAPVFETAIPEAIAATPVEMAAAREAYGSAEDAWMELAAWTLGGVNSQTNHDVKSTKSDEHFLGRFYRLSIVAVSEVDQGGDQWYEPNEKYDCVSCNRHVILLLLNSI